MLLLLMEMRAPKSIMISPRAVGVLSNARMGSWPKCKVSNPGLCGAQLRVGLHLCETRPAKDEVQLAVNPTAVEVVGVRNTVVMSPGSGDAESDSC